MGPVAIPGASSSGNRPLVTAAGHVMDGDVASSSLETMAAFMPENTDSGNEEEEEDDNDYLGGLPADPLLSRAAGRGQGEVYELRESVERGRKGNGRKPAGLDLGEALYYYDDDDDDDGGGGGGIGGEQSGKEFEEDIVYTADEEKAVVRKFDRRLVLFVALLYLLSFLDRSNIGNAYAAGMDADLGAGAHHTTNTTPSYEMALSAFYGAYIAFEWLSLLWGVVPAHVYVAGLVASWGVVASLQAVVGSYGGLVALRFLLGIGEAGFTGIPIYLSFFFRREELALRTAVFISAAPLATAFASSLAWVILKLGQRGPIAPWRLLFLLEGFPAVLVATIAWRVIPDSPDRASYLTAREKQIAKDRLLRTPRHRKGKAPSEAGSEGQHSIQAADDALRRRQRPGFLARACKSTATVLRDPIPWTTAAIFLLTNVAYSSLPVFLPAILEQMGHSPLASQALSAPPYLVAFGAVLAVAKLSDALRARAVLIAVAALASAGGYALLALARRIDESSGGGGGGGGGSGWLAMARYLAVYPAAGGFFCVVVLTMVWNVNNAREGHGKGGAFALMQVVGQLGPLVGTRLYPKTDGPWFERGMGICAAAMCGVAVLAIGLRWKLVRANRGLDGRARAGEEGDDGFRYML